MSLLVLYKNKKFMINCGIANVLSVIVSDVYRYVVLGCRSDADMKNYQLQVACLLLSTSAMLCLSDTLMNPMVL